MSGDAAEMSELAAALAPVGRSQFMPAISIEAAVERYSAREKLCRLL